MPVIRWTLRSTALAAIIPDITLDTGPWVMEGNSTAHILLETTSLQEVTFRANGLTLQLPLAIVNYKHTLFKKMFLMYVHNHDILWL